MVDGPILTPTFPILRKKMHKHTQMTSHTKDLPFEPTQTRRALGMHVGSSAHTPTHTSLCTPPCHPSAHAASWHSPVQDPPLPSPRRCNDRRKDSKPQAHSFTCLVSGGEAVVWGAGPLETQIQETETQAPFGHREGCADSDGNLSCLSGSEV